MVLFLVITFCSTSKFSFLSKVKIVVCKLHHGEAKNFPNFFCLRLVISFTFFCSKWTKNWKTIKPQGENTTSCDGKNNNSQSIFYSVTYRNFRRWANRVAATSANLGRTFAVLTKAQLTNCRLRVAQEDLNFMVAFWICLIKFVNNFRASAKRRHQRYATVVRCWFIEYRQACSWNHSCNSGSETKDLAVCAIASQRETVSRKSAEAIFHFIVKHSGTQIRQCDSPCRSCGHCKESCHVYIPWSHEYCPNNLLTC